MGMYTELYLAVELSEETPEEILGFCRAAAAKTAEWDRENPLNPMLSGGSFYFDAQPHVVFRTEQGNHYLTFVTNVKDYGDELGALVEFLSPWIVSDGHIGHYRYEGDEMPTILFRNEEGVIEWRELNAVREPKKVKVVPHFVWAISAAPNGDGSLIYEPEGL